MRLNQFIAESGICSRRDADNLISQGCVSVNGKVAALGLLVGEKDEVLLNGKLIKKEEERIVILLNKPRGITSTTNIKDKSNIVDYVNYGKRLFMVGRLDKNSEGAILLTNEGNYVNRLLRGENSHEKVYHVTVDKPLTENFINKMSNGVKIFNPDIEKHIVTKKCNVKKISDKIFEITLTQGFNRQIRRMCSALTYNVKRLVRVKFLFLTLENLKYGAWRKLTKEEIARLDEICENSKIKI